VSVFRFPIVVDYERIKMKMFEIDEDRDQE
jgi:hypothetical protein